MNPNGVFGFYDPEPTAGELVFGFIDGQLELVLALESAAATNATAECATAAGAAHAATTAIAPTSGASTGAGAGNASTGTLSTTSDVATAAGAAHDATVDDGSAPPAVPDDEPTHSGASNIQWQHSSFYRPAPVTPPKPLLIPAKKKVLVDADEEELIALGVL